MENFHRASHLVFSFCFGVLDHRWLLPWLCPHHFVQTLHFSVCFSFSPVLEFELTSPLKSERSRPPAEVYNPWDESTQYPLVSLTGSCRWGVFKQLLQPSSHWCKMRTAFFPKWACCFLLSCSIFSLSHSCMSVLVKQRKISIGKEGFGKDH